MMEYKIEDNRIRWAFKGEEVLAEVCGTESIRVRASFGSPVDEKRNYNLKKSEDLEGKPCFVPETCGQRYMMKDELPFTTGTRRF